ncbi:hypothetical protein [Stackebrandtia nassauensis]|uniref:Uncharacterized protein n=1 Tax=Stackebrandtia nassauensis (strain DSM 44728 / CIP 108903 / NRRL B-16338 / NBRC 102104 / LLR-40K-21) TaxID=446470 RepID=D3Q357_STANL|nr:hypothetical protein [Stackebrandtia nassauensis]ADD40027.1 hypothetical protein Snas_0309 [Stackebrandtia nassauensis DSM 44728]
MPGPTYDTPWPYFYGLGAALLVFSAVYLLDDWIETHLGFVASVLAVAKRQTSQPAEPFKVLASRRWCSWACSSPWSGGRSSC